MFYPFGRIETKWRKIWEKNKIYEPLGLALGKPSLKSAKKPIRRAQGKPFYNLMMFPYPSGEGLHVGNMYAFTGSDIFGRFKRMNGYDVFEPMGLDGFGIHSENYALKTGVHPAKQIKITEKNFYRQLEMIGNGFAWREKVETYDPEYYKWTQWLFIQLFKKGLAYRAKAAVNWCLGCKTVLADEQVINGKCERCSSEVVKKELEQWFFRITEYAERLLKNLDKIDWSEKIKIAQRNWIGKKEGALIKFQIPNSKIQIEVFTTRPDTIFGATFLVLAPQHPLIKNLENRIKNLEEIKKYIKDPPSHRASAGQGKTGVELKGVKAVNPANNKEIPIWVADYVLGDVGTGAIMAVPAHDERDKEFAEKFGLPIVEAPLVDPYTYRGSALLARDSNQSSIGVGVDKNEILKKVGGQPKIQYHLRDWLISRQRYWGPPIPMIFCKKCSWQPAPEKDLPVKLPFIKDFRPTGKGESPLASAKSFYETKCPKCGGKARRETDVSDTFLDSSWYYIAYLAKIRNSLPVRQAGKFEIRNSRFQKIARKWLPVHMYIGGAEHAVLHLMYSRFIAMVLHDLGLIHFEEPFKVFRAHGLLIREGAKISKSKGNVVNPDEYVRKFGADVFRMYLMFLAPFEQGGDFRDASIMGIKRFLERVWRLFSNIRTSDVLSISRTPDVQKLNRLLHQTIKKVTEDIENLRYNIAISALMILFNEIEKNTIDKKTAQIFLKLLAPFAPFLTEELWQAHFSSQVFHSIHLEKWPQCDAKKIKEEKIVLIVQVNGRLRDTVEMEKGLSRAAAEKLALSRTKIQAFLNGVKPKKTIFVPDKVINFII